MTHFRGDYPSPTVACFDATSGELPRRQLDVNRNNRFLQRLSTEGAASVLIGASTGHGHVRTPEELDHWFRSTNDVDLGDTVKIALLRPEDGVEWNRRLVQTLAESGFQIAFVRPGTDLPADASDETISENIEPVVQAIAESGLKAGIYSISDVSGIPLRPPAAAILSKKFRNELIAIKVTEADYAQSTQLFFQHPDLKDLTIVQGWDPHLAQALQENPERCGVTSGAMSFAFYQYQHILNCAKEANWEEVAKSQVAVTALFEAMQDTPGKFADLQRAKFIMGLGQPMISKVNSEQVERVFSALENMERPEDKNRLARSLDLMQDGPYTDRLNAMV